MSWDSITPHLSRHQLCQWPWWVKTSVRVQLQEQVGKFAANLCSIWWFSRLIDLWNIWIIVRNIFFLLLILQLDVAVFSFESFKLILKFVSFFLRLKMVFWTNIGVIFFFGPLKGWFQIKSHLFSMSFLQIYIFCVFFRCLPIQVRQQPICFQYWRDWFTDHNSLPWQECSF